MEHIISMTDINKGYQMGEEKVPILKNISFSVDKGEYVAILGPSGSGKTTLMNIIGCMDEMDSGEYFLNGRAIHDAKEQELTEIRNKEIGFIFQNYQLIPTYNVLQNISMPLLMRGYGHKEAEEMCMDMINMLGIAHRIAHKPNELSGGQKRRVAIAGVLAMKPEVLILDEPTAGLDPAGRDEILGMISKMHKELGITVILVSHSMEDVAKYVDRIIVMNQGKVLMDDVPREIFKRHKELEEVGLSAPQVTYIMEDLRKKGLQVDTSVLTIEEARDEILRALLK